MARQAFGTIDNRGTTSRPRWRARYPDPTHTGDGRAPRITAPHTFPTKRAAEAWLAAQWAAISAGTWVHPDEARRREEETARERDLRDLTVAQWAATWMERLARTAAAGTVRKRRSDLRTHILPAFGDHPLASLTTRGLAQWWDSLRCGPGARKNAYETLRALLNAAVDDDSTLLDANPLRVRGATAEHRAVERHLLAPAEISAIANAVPAPYRALVVLLADAGLRINEALALTRSCVRGGPRGGSLAVAVEHSLHRDGRRLVPGPTKTPAGVRRVVLMPATAGALAAHLDTHVAPGPNAIIFPGPRGGWARDTALAKILDRALAVAGVDVPAGKRAGWHMFRHYSATRFGQAGATTRALMVRYGWSDPDMAARYQRADEDYERELVARMAARQAAALEERPHDQPV